MRNYHDGLSQLLQEELSWHKARVRFVVLFILALLKVRSVNWVKLSCAMSGQVKQTSNYRRIQRFFSDYFLNYKQIAHLILRLLPQKTDFLIIIDRTEWQFGKFYINVMMASIVYRGIAFPITWTLLNKKGISNTKERKQLLKRVFRFVGKKHIRAIIADREFVGKDWLNYLNNQQVKFYIRIRENALVSIKGTLKPIKCIFESLVVQQEKILRKKRIVYGNKLYIAGMKLNHKEYLIIATNENPYQALKIYQKRWETETLFAALKSRGFNFEDTHINKTERIEKLIALMAIAFCWAHLVGEWLNNLKPLKIKKHGYKEKSIFRYGLDFLQHILLNIQDKIDDFFQCLKLLHNQLNC